MRFFLFGTLFLLVMAAANYYVYRRFFKVLSPAFSRYAFLIPTVLMLGEIVFVVELLTHFLIESPLLYTVLSSFVGITFLLFVVATVYDLTITVSRRVPFDQRRRQFIKIVFDITMLIAAFSYLLRGLSQGLKTPLLNTVHVKIDNFPFKQFSLVQLSDIHVGVTIKRRFMQQLVERTNALAPDLVVITGDLVDLPIDYIREDLQPLQQLQAPTYFILGNHEYFHEPNSILEFVRSLGIQPLLNDAVQIGDTTTGFNLIGINDLSSRRIGLLPYDLERAYHKANSTQPCIVLAHQPKTIELLDSQRCDLMLSGHTHGGQIFPFGLLVMVDQPYLAGLHQHDADKQIFVSRGAGYWGPPIRVLAPSEISHIIIQPRATS